MDGLLCPWDSPGKNTGMGCHSLQGIFLTQGSNLDLLLCRWILYYLSHQGSPACCSLKPSTHQFSERTELILSRSMMCLAALEFHSESIKASWVLLPSASVSSLSPGAFPDSLIVKSHSLKQHLRSSLLVSITNCSYAARSSRVSDLADILTSSSNTTFKRSWNPNLFCKSWNPLCSDVHSVEVTLSGSWPHQSRRKREKWVGINATSSF